MVFSTVLLRVVRTCTMSCINDTISDDSELELVL